MLPYLLATLGCAPTYAKLDPIEPDALWSPLPVHHVRVRDMDIAYVDSALDAPDGLWVGRSETPIIFIHGLSSYASFWEYQIPYFAKDYRVLALDLPGYGASSRPDAPYTPPWFADVLGDFMDAVGVEKATLVGHSMGGQIAITFALAHPSRVERLALSAPAGFESFSPGVAAWSKGYWTENRARQATEDEVRANFTSLVFNRVDRGVERLIEERVRMGNGRAFAGTSVAVSRSIAGMFDFPVYDRLDRLRMPVLAVFGTDDRMIPNPVFTGGRTRAIAERGVAKMRDAKLVMIPGAGHTVHHDAPDEFNAALDRFIP